MRPDRHALSVVSEVRKQVQVRRRTGFDLCGCRCCRGAGTPCWFVPERNQHHGADGHCRVDDRGENPCPPVWCARLDQQVTQGAEAENECARTDDCNSRG